MNKTGKYRLTSGRTFRCGVSNIQMAEGSVVEIKQVDKEYRKVLVDFGDRDIDWQSDIVLDYLEKI